MEKILVTGSTGFVGHHLIERLSSKYQVIGLDRQASTNTKSVNYHSVDLTDKAALASQIRKYRPDGIIHLAAIATTWEKDARQVFDVNLMGTLNLYQSVSELKQNDGYDPKILFISSSEVYGRATNPENITEQELLQPNNFYATSKAAADRLTYQYSQSQGLNTVILRPFNHTGPGQRPGFFVPDMVSQIVKLESSDKNELSVGNLSAVRDFSDVRDVVRAYQLVLETELKRGEVYNICSGRGVSMQSVLDKLLAMAKKPIEVVVDPSRIRPSDTPVFVGNHDKLTQDTNWQPEIDLDTTLKDSLTYWRSTIEEK